MSETRIALFLDSLTKWEYTAYAGIVQERERYNHTICPRGDHFNTEHEGQLCGSAKGNLC